MKPITAVALIMLSFVLLAGVLAYMSFLLITNAHPVFGALFGVAGLISFLSLTSVEIKSK